MRILVFDSGLGGLSVFRPITRQLPDAQMVYAADNAGFPYGRWSEDELAERITALMGALIDAVQPDIGVIACNTASTIVLRRLRKTYAIPFVGTVPAIKVAAGMSRSRCFSVLATPGTVTRVYTKELVERFAPDCRVKLVGVRGLAGLVEAKLRGVRVERDHLASLVAPAFVSDGERRTDTIVLACTHYPLLMDELEAAAPWPVHFIDPGPAIARQVSRVAGALERKGAGQGEGKDLASPKIVFTADIGPGEDLKSSLEAYGFSLPPQILPGWRRDRGFDGISG